MDKLDALPRLETKQQHQHKKSITCTPSAIDTKCQPTNDGWLGYNTVKHQTWPKRPLNFFSNYNYIRYQCALKGLSKVTIQN